MRISCRVGLRLEESIEIPEGRFHIPICFHFLETHFGKNFLELLSSFEQNVQVAVLNISSFGHGVKILELVIFPRPRRYHGACYLCLKFNFLLSIFLSLPYQKISFLLFFH